MAYQSINLGTTDNDDTGDFPKPAGIKINANFTELYLAAATFGTAAPTTGARLQGQFIKNSTPIEDGTTGAKFVNLGWICVSSGTPGTWVPCRVFTGN